VGPRGRGRRAGARPGDPVLTGLYLYRAAPLAADMDSMTRISVVLPTLDRPEAIYNLLRHLEHQSARPLEIVVVDQS